jgi:hypothetical protein
LNKGPIFVENVVTELDVLAGIFECLPKNKNCHCSFNNNNNNNNIFCDITNTKNVFAVVDCGPLSGLEHGYVNLKDKRTTHGASAEYTCHENYTLIGRERRTCQDGGQWSDDQPQCLCKLQ